MKKPELRHLCIYAIGFGTTLVIVWTFWFMLAVGSAKITIDANSLGEYWWEFVILNSLIVVMFYYTIKQAVIYWKSDE
jgi:hypothetical protein